MTGVNCMGRGCLHRVFGSIFLMFLRICFAEISSRIGTGEIQHGRNNTKLFYFRN